MGDMNIFMTGGTGLIGKALTSQLLNDGHSVTIMTRNIHRARQAFPKSDNDIRLVDNCDQLAGNHDYDAIVNLAGAPILEKRWTKRRKKKLLDSRVSLTQSLISKLKVSPQKPTVFVSGSAIGYYGDTGDQIIDEKSPKGTDFGALLVADWENAAAHAEQLGIRTCLIRTGLVLSDTGGMLSKMKLPFKLYLGAQIGHGNQWMSWIHIDDQVQIICNMLTDPAYQGVYNLCAPNPVTNGEFTHALAASLNSRAFFRAPEWMIRLILSEAGMLLTGGQRVLPHNLQQHGYEFRFKDLKQALTAVWRI